MTLQKFKPTISTYSQGGHLQRVLAYHFVSSKAWLARQVGLGGGGARVSAGLGQEFYELRWAESGGVEWLLPGSEELQPSFWRFYRDCSH